MKTKKIVALILTAIMTTGVLAGCGSTASTSSTSSTTPAANENVVVTLGCWGSSPAETKLLDDQIQAYQNDNPKVTIKKIVAVGDYGQQLQTKIASKTAPDVFYLDVNLASAYIKKGVLAPIDEYLDKADLADFQPNLLKSYQKDGKTYGLPKDYNTLGLFYDKTMLDAAGVQVPTTWAELTAAAQKLTKGKVVGLALPDDAARFIPFLYQGGLEAMADKDGKPTFNTPEAAKGLAVYYDLLKKGYAKTPKDLGDDWSGASFTKGHAAMVIEGGWLIPSIKESAPNLKYGIAKLPKGDKEGDIAFTLAYVMNKDSKNKKAASEVLKYLTGKKAQQMTAEAGLAIPSRISMGTVFSEKNPNAKALVDQTSISSSWDLGVNGSKIIDALAKSGEKLRLGKVADAAAALKDAQDSIK